MTDSIISRQSDSSEIEMNEQIQKAVIDAIKADDKIVKIKPAKESKGSGMFARMILIVGAFAAGYWLWKSQKSSKKSQSTTSETADQPKKMPHQAAPTTEQVSGMAAEKTQESSSNSYDSSSSS